MEETQHFIVNGHDHGIASLGEYRKDDSRFSNLTEHRLNDEDPSGGCSKTAGCECAGEDPRQRSGYPHLGSASEKLHDSSSERLPPASRIIAEAAEESQVGEALDLLSSQSDVFSLFGGIDTEVVFLEDSSLGGCHCAPRANSGLSEVDELRPGQTLQLGIATGLVVISAADPAVSVADDIQAPILSNLNFTAHKVDACAKPGGAPEPLGTQTLLNITPPPQEGVVEPVCDGWKVDDNEWKFRVNKITGCKEWKLVMIRAAYGLAYKVVRSAERELAYIATQFNSGTQKLLWDSYGGWENECSLAFWFGKADGPDFALRLEHVSRIIRRWSRGFREGFYHNSKKPVLIHCKPNDCTEATAQHIIRNYIVLCKQWMDLPDPIDRMIVLMHEMGHYSDGDIYHPRDEKYEGICMGGWKPYLNKQEHRYQCYRGTETRQTRHAKYAPDPTTSAHDLFREYPTADPLNWLARNNPRELVKVFDGYPTDDVSEKTAIAVRKVFLNNVDNYTCYMWNRWVDRGYCHLEGLTPDAKQAP